MVEAHAGFINGAKCLRKKVTAHNKEGATFPSSHPTHTPRLPAVPSLSLKDPLVGWDDCAEWGKVTCFPLLKSIHTLPKTHPLHSILPAPFSS